MDANPSRKRSENQFATPVEHNADASSTKAGMLRERERGQLLDQIEDLRRRLDAAEAERAKLNAVLTDQRRPRVPVL